MSTVVVEQSVPEASVVAVKERMEEFVARVALASMNHPAQRENAERYVRGLLAAGPRKSLEPLVDRLDGEGDYQSLQQFLADSPWDAGRVIQAVVERTAPALDVQAWVLGIFIGTMLLVGIGMLGFFDGGIATKSSQGPTGATKHPQNGSTGLQSQPKS